MRTVGARSHFVLFLTSPVLSKGGQHRKSIFETALGFVPSVLFLQRLAHVLLPCFNERVLQWIPFGNTVYIASFRICGGPVKVQCTCASHLRWTCKGTVHLCFASAVDSFYFEYSVLSSDNEDWCQWAFAFSTSQGEKPYTVPELLEKILTQHKLHLAGNGKTKATAFLAGHLLHKPPKFKHPRTNKNNKQGKPKKKCKTEGCSNHVSHHFHKWCDDCYDKHKKKSTTDDSETTLNEVPLAVRKENHSRKLAALKKKMALINSATTKKKRESALHEANALLADVSTGLAKKGKKCVNIEEEEVGMAEACALQNLKPSSELKVTSKRKSLHARIAKQGKFAHTSGKLANKKKLPKANEQAAEQDPLLGLTVQRFAGCAMPSNYSK